MLPSSRTALRLSGLSATDALPNRNAISKVPRAAGYRVAISSPGTQQKVCQSARACPHLGVERKQGRLVGGTLSLSAHAPELQ
jgi:hypothetical protein